MHAFQFAKDSLKQVRTYIHTIATNVTCDQFFFRSQFLTQTYRHTHVTLLLFLSLLLLCPQSKKFRQKLSVVKIVRSNNRTYFVSQDKISFYI